MLLYELLDLINDNSIVIIYDENQRIIGSYDGKESIPEDFSESQVWDIFPDTYTIGQKKLPSIGIEIEYLPFD